MTSNPITVRRDFPRPSPDETAALAAAPTCNICDAQGRQGGLDHRIKAVTQARHFAGPALTVRCRPCDNLAAWVAVESVRPGDVVVIANGGYEGAAVIGDLYTGILKNKGAAAVVTDGMARDVDELDALGIPVFARGLTPNSPFKEGPGAVGLPMVVAGVAIDAGDLVIGDGDGVAVVPRAKLAEVTAALEQVKSKEAASSAKIDAGETPDWVAATIAAATVQAVD